MPKCGDYGWKDYTVECKTKLITDIGSMGYGIVLRRPCFDCTPCFVFALDTKFNRAFIGTPSLRIIGSVPFQPRKDVWYTLKAVAQGEQLEFYVDNNLVIETKDNAFPAGKTGFEVINFDGFSMTS
jgi:hypothetical protein